MENKVKVIPLRNVDDITLDRISRDNLLALNCEEMKCVQTYFRQQRRDPTDIELETIAQTWSEHCKHKTLTGVIEYKSEVLSPKSEDKNRQSSMPDATVGTGVNRQLDADPMPLVKRYNNLLKETVMKVTTELNKKWCISVFKDNAGIIEFNDKYGVAFKVETHNHPSALEPYGGAGTGIGGVIRDILGVGLGAKPVANTDVFCFGLPEYPQNKLSAGVLHPKRIFKGVVSGVRDYGNRMGIPTVNGAVLFDEEYTYNPLVYCGTVGLIPKDKCFKQVKPGDVILAVGGRTGRDGIHGATFSSLSLDKDTPLSPVQIGNAIMEKKTMDVILQTRDLNLYRAITDCGAGGFSSAVGELGAECGVKVYLDRAPLKYEGLLPWEIWLSEAQERMVLAVPPDKIKLIQKMFTTEDVETTVLGTFTNTGRMELFYRQQKICDLEMDFLHNGVPIPTNTAIWRVASSEQRVAVDVNPLNKADGRKQKAVDFGILLKQVLGMLNVCSKEWIIRQYDHEVQGQTVVKPLQGQNSGPGDAAVIWPITAVQGSRPFPPGRICDSPDGVEVSTILKPRLRGTSGSEYRGIAIGCGINPHYGKIDPYWMAAAVIDEAIRNIVAVGGDPARTALLDNFCWGNPNKPDQLAGVVRAAQACYDFAKVYETPFISGKDSLNNEYIDQTGVSRSIPGTLLISALSIVPDIRKTVTIDFKEPGNLIYVLGETKNELLGSQYSLLFQNPQYPLYQRGIKGGFIPYLRNGGRKTLLASFYNTHIPQVNPKKAKKLFRALHRAIKLGLVQSCHDCSDGGLAVTLAEMSFAGGLGIEVRLDKIPVPSTVYRLPFTDTVILFSESTSRFVVEISPKDKTKFERMMEGTVFTCIGKTVASLELRVYSKEQKIIIKEEVRDLESAWRKTLAW